MELLRRPAPEKLVADLPRPAHRFARFDGFDLDELSYLAGKAHLPEKPVLDTAKGTVARFHEVWAREKAHLPQAVNVTKAIDAHLGKLPLAKL